MVPKEQRTRRHMPAMSPVRLLKSAAGYVPKIKSSTSGFNPTTPDGCLPANDKSRPWMYNRICASDTYSANACPAGYGSFGYADVPYTFGDTCQKRDMICVKNNYPLDNSSVANCCTGATPSKDCDPSLCPTSKACRDRMITFCNSDTMFGTPVCQTWMGLPGNEDIRDTIMSSRCTAASMTGNSPCRQYALNAGQGKCDAAVTSFCKSTTIVPSICDAKLAEYYQWRVLNGKTPAWINDTVTDLNRFELSQYLGVNMDPRGTPIKNQYERAFVVVLSTPDLRAACTNPTTSSVDNSKDPMCACINSSLNKLGDKSPPPSCFDSQCRNGGYMTGIMKTISQACPSWSECRSMISASSGGTISNVNVQQICGGPSTPTNSPTTPPTNSPSTPATNPPSNSTANPLSLPTPPMTDAERLAADQANAGNKTPAVIAAAPLAPSLSDQLNAPWMPGYTQSLGTVAILFFALIIISAILWRAWRSRHGAETQALEGAILEQENRERELIRAAESQQTAQVQASLGSIPPVGAA